MRSLFCSALALSLALAAHPAAAQNYEDMSARLEASMATAQAQAARPGDEDLDCDQLQAEFTSMMQDPAVQGVIAQQGAHAEEQMRRYNEARGRAQAQMGVGLFMGLAGSFVPGLGYAAMAQQRMQAAQQQRDAQRNMAEMMEMSERMSSIMPQLMRGQRVHELAQARQCEFLQQPQQ